MAYNFTAEWHKGKENNALDALSRNPVFNPQVADTLGECNVGSSPEMSIAELRAIASNGQESVPLQDVHRYADNDEEYQQLRSLILNSFPDCRNQLPCRRM